MGIRSQAFWFEYFYPFLGLSLLVLQTMGLEEMVSKVVMKCYNVGPFGLGSKDRSTKGQLSSPYSPLLNHTPFGILSNLGENSTKQTHNPYTDFISFSSMTLFLFHVNEEQ